MAVITALAVAIVAGFAVAGRPSDQPREYTETDASTVIALTRAFIERTGITDPGTIAAFVQADVNRDTVLSWDEIARFQTELYSRYRFLDNDTALRPDHFFRDGGGDCEDWALVTAGLLRFWQIDVVVRVYVPESISGASM